MGRLTGRSLYTREIRALNSFTYKFYIDGKEHHLKHDEYMKDESLRALVNDEEGDRYRLFLGLTIVSCDLEFLRGKKEYADRLSAIEKQQKDNPLMFYAPNTDEQLGFINDNDGSMFAMVDPNRTGKTTAAWIKVLVGHRPMLNIGPTEHKKWPLFRDHGVLWHKFKRPLSVGICSYNTAKLEDPLWKEIVKKWTPDNELGMYGRTYSKNNRKHSPSWGHDRLTIFKKSKSQLGYYTYEMDQGNYEGGALDIWMWDEQGRRPMFDGADRGTRTTGGFHIMSLTPHKVEGRPDTGAAGWLYPVLTGKKTLGHKVKVHSGRSIDDVPDWVYSLESKEMEKEKWVHEPERTGDRKMIAEGRARVFGEWHRSAGLVLDEWDERTHWIEPLWKYPPEELSLFRSIDHGITNPTVNLWWAVDKSGNVFIYRSYYSRGRTIAENVRNIIEQSGNSRKRLMDYSSEKTGVTIQRWEENFDREAISKTAMDSRSFSLSDTHTGIAHGKLYQWAGLRVKKAAGKFTDHWVPLLNQLLLPDPTHKHPVTGEVGAPHLYIFSCPENEPLKREIEGWVYEEQKGRTEDKNPSEKPRDKDNHGPTAMGYGVMMGLKWDGGQGLWKSGNKHVEARDPNNYWADPLIKRRRKRPDNGYRPIG